MSIFKSFKEFFNPEKAQPTTYGETLKIEPEKEPLYYVQNKDAGHEGKAARFYTKEENGYTGFTSDLDKCHAFTEDEAKQLYFENINRNKPWPKDYIDSNMGVSRIVDFQLMDTSKIKTFNK